MIVIFLIRNMIDTRPVVSRYSATDRRGVLLATPLAWYLIDRWLNNFAYSITITGTSFVFAGGITLLLALLSICLLTIKAAWKNPAESLKYE